MSAYAKINIYWFKKLGLHHYTLLTFCKEYNLLYYKSLTSTEAAVNKKTSILRKSNKDDQKIK